MLVLLVLTSVFTNMSQNVQGAIIIVGVLQLFDYAEFFHLWRISKIDWLVWVTTFLFTIFLGVEIGIAVGVAVSLLVVLFRSAFPAVRMLGRIPDTKTFRARDLYPGVTTTPGVLVVKIESQLYFASVDPIREKINVLIKSNTALGDPPSYLVLDFVASNSIDSTGMHWLESFVRNIRADRGITTVIANPTHTLLVHLKTAGLVDVIGPENIHVNLRSAVAWAVRGLEDSKKGGESSAEDSNGNGNGKEVSITHDSIV